MEKKKLKRNFAKSLFSFICVFLSVLLTFVFLIAMVVKTSVYDSSYYINAIHNTKYSEYLAEDIRKEMVHLGEISIEDCPKSIFEDVVYNSKVQSDTLDHIAASMINRSAAIDVSRLKQELTQGLDTFVLQTYPEFADDPEVKADLKLLVDSCATAYIDAVSMDAIKVIGSITYKTSRLLDIVIAISATFAVVFAMCIIFLNRRISKRLMYYTILLSTVLLSVAIIPIVFYATGIATRIPVTSAHLQVFVSEIISGIAFKFLMITIILAALTAILIVVNVIYNKYRRR